MAYAFLQKDLCLFHITHLKNIPTILKKGLLSKNSIRDKNIGFTDVSEDKIQQARATKLIPGAEHVLHDCVPMFFGARPPMLYAVRCKGIQQEEIIYVLIKWDVIHRQDVWFTDGNARTEGTSFYQGEANLSQIDFDAVVRRYWGETEELKRKKQSEVLKLNQILLDEIIGFAVYNEEVKIKLEKMLSAQQIDKKIYVAREFYY